MTDRAITDLAPDATHSRPLSRWEPAAERYAQALLPEADALQAVELALVCAQFEGAVDDREVIRGAIRVSVASRLTESAVVPAGGAHRECAGIPELLLTRAHERVSDAEEALLSEHLAWCDRCRALDEKIRHAELAFDAPPPAGRFKRPPVAAPEPAAAPAPAAPPPPSAPPPAGARRPAASPPPVPSELRPPAPSIDPEFDASAPAMTVAIPWTQDDTPPSRDEAPSRWEPTPVARRVSRRLAGAVAAALLVLSGIAVAAVLRSAGPDDSERARSVVTPVRQPPPQLGVELAGRPPAGRATADRSAARERERAAAERRRRQAQRRAAQRRAAQRRAAARRARRRSQASQPRSPTPSPAPAAPTTPAPRATPPAPRRNISPPAPRRNAPPPRRRPTSPSPQPPASQTGTPENPVPTPPSDAPGRRPG